MKNYGIDLKYNESNEYKEAYVCEWLADKYLKNQIYCIEFTDDNGEKINQNIKVIDYFDVNNQRYHNFKESVVKEIDFHVLICDKVQNYNNAKLNAGIFIGDLGVDYYKNLGYESISCGDIYKHQWEMQLDGAEMYIYFTIVLLIFVIVTIACNYFLSVDIGLKQKTVNFISGMNNKTLGIIECVKMLVLFVVPFVLNIILTACFSQKYFLTNKGLKGILDFDFLWISSLIVLVVYFLSVLIGFIKYIRTKPIKIISSEQ